jgi:RimJ/RimL family protein N-acetyltransferase
MLQPHPPAPLHLKNFKTGAPCWLVPAVDYTDSDIARVTQICGQPALTALFTERLGGRAYTKDDAREFLIWCCRGWGSRHYFVFFVRDASGNILAACDIKSADAYAEVGYWADSDTPGVMTQAVIALTTWGRSVGFQRLFALVQPTNTRSRGVAERAGFTFVGQLIRDGKIFDRLECGK